jgi:predicted nucleotidyltransferase
LYDNTLGLHDNLQEFFNLLFFKTFLIEKTRGRTSVGNARINIPKEKIADFCKQNQIRKLYLFGSVLRGDFGPGSDIDVLVEFEPGTRIGLIGLSGLEIELGDIIGRKVDLNTPGFLSKYYRDKILGEAEVQYDAA